MLKLLARYVLWRVAALRTHGLSHAERDAVSFWLLKRAPSFGGSRWEGRAWLAIAALIAASTGVLVWLAVFYLVYDANMGSGVGNARASLGDAMDELIENGWQGITLEMLIGVLAGACAGGLGVLLWLRRGALALLRRRDICSTCGHVLAGSPLIDALRCRCPECGMIVDAIDAWGEVSRPGSGDSAVFNPARALAPVFWTKRRVRITALSLCSAASLALLVFAIRWTIIDIDARLQARAARHDRLSADDITKKLARGETDARSPGELTRNQIVQDIAQKIHELSTNFPLNKVPGLKDDDTVFIENIAQAGAKPEALSSKSHRHAIDLYEHIKAAGLIDKLDTLDEHAPDRSFTYIPPDADAAAAPVDAMRLDELRRTSTLCIARLRIAVLNKNDHEFERASTIAIHLIELSDIHPFAINRLVCTAQTRALLSEYRQLLRADPTPRMLDVMQQTIKRLHVRPYNQAVEEERLFVIDSMQHHFSDHARIKRGMNAFRDDVLYRMLYDVDGTPQLGTYAENFAALNWSFDMHVKRASLLPWQRERPAEPAEHWKNLWFFTAHFAMLKAQETEDRLVLLRQSVLAMIAIQRYRIEHGRFPSIEAFALMAGQAPCFLDPFSGVAMGYRSSGDAYELWSVGHDGVDNSGKTEECCPDKALRASGDGLDVLINSPKDW